MARYMIFAKTKSFQYSFKGSAEGKNGNDAIQKLRGRSRLSTKSPYIAIPSKTFMRYQLNPTTKVARAKKKGDFGSLATIWKKPK